MRRFTLSLWSQLAAFAALATSLSLTPACGSSDASAFGDETQPSPEDGIGGGNDATFGSSDAAAPPAALYRGSPLCRMISGTCSPDDDGSGSAYGAAACATPAKDDGDGGVVSEAMGCRLSGSPASPTCSTAKDEGVDGAECKTGADCAPGFDCIEGEKTSVCRRYCCAGTCKGQTSQNGGPTFSDVQQLVDINPGVAPVCMPLKRCKLLTAGECGDKETCGIVNEEGDTGCVANGNAQAGASCEEDHCNVGLTCLGTPGNRTCYQLCTTNGDVPCGPTQVCKTGTLFPEGKFGVCTTVSSATP